MTNEFLICVLMIVIVVLGGFCCYLCTKVQSVSAIVIYVRSEYNVKLFINGTLAQTLYSGTWYCKILPAKTRINIVNGNYSACFSTKSNKVHEVTV
jgi:hypothetical protein